LRRIKPDLLLLAEASARDGRYYMRSGFDAAYDWTDSLGVWSWGEAFSGAGNVAHRLRMALTRQSKEQIRVFRFLNNNDTGARFVTRHGVAMTRVAATLLLTLPGIPGLYTGDEVGAEFEPYNQREPIRWADAHGLRNWYSTLLRLRHTLPALRSGELRLLDAGKAGEVVGYVRPGQQPRDDVLVLLNFGPEPIEVSLPARLGQPAAGSKLVDLLSGETLADAEGRIRLAGHGARIMQVR
jgi:glycosidase